MMEKVCLPNLPIFPRVISPNFIPKSLYSKVRTLSLKVVPFNVSADRPQVSVRGKLFKSIGHWQFLGAPDFILSIIKCRYKISFISTPPPQHYKNNGSAVNECECTGYAILELLRDNRIEEVFSSPDIINPLSVSVHSSGKKSLILDLRHVNLHIFKQNLGVKIYIPLRTFFQKAFSFSPMI